DRANNASSPLRRGRARARRVKKCLFFHDFPVLCNPGGAPIPVNVPVDLIAVLVSLARRSISVLDNGFLQFPQVMSPLAPVSEFEEPLLLVEIFGSLPSGR